MNKLYLLAVCVILVSSCNNQPMKHDNSSYPAKPVYNLYDDPNRFADVEILRYNVPGFENLTLQQKLLVYYLSEAALCGRDIIYDQNNKWNLRLRKSLEELYVHYEGDKKSEEFRRFEVYLKRIWMSNGIHHHYAEVKINPEFSSSFLMEMIKKSPKAALPMKEPKDTAGFTTWLVDLIFNPATCAKRVNKDDKADPIRESSNNFYENLNASQVELFYADKKKKDSIEPVSWGLNSKLVMENNAIIEKVWKVGGMYGQAISKIVEWLEKAQGVAETPEQKASLGLLVEFYRSGNLKTWDEYNIAWVKDVQGSIDVINGFIEVYHDAIGMRASYESSVEINDVEASKRMGILAAHAQWFEDNSPIAQEFRKSQVTGITYKVVNVAMEAGDLAPSTAIGVNLPNAEWIREKYGSKSVSFGNIVDAYNKANSGPLLSEFCWDEAQVQRSKEYGQLAAKLHTALHEVIGHASGKMNKGVTKDMMGTYGSTLEEGRADLVALYYLMDPKLIEIGVIPSLEVGMAEYDEYIRNGLMVQLRRVEEGHNIEEDHMRNRQLVALWAYEQGKQENVIEKKMRDGKTFFVVNDYQKLRTIFGRLLNLIQHIKSTGDQKEAKKLVETYGVKVNRNIHTEVLKRSKALDVAPYRGFIQPHFTLVMENDKIIDVKLNYSEPFVDQMLRYSRDYSFLPLEN